MTRFARFHLYSHLFPLVLTRRVESSPKVVGVSFPFLHQRRDYWKLLDAPRSRESRKDRRESRAEPTNRRKLSEEMFAIRITPVYPPLLSLLPLFSTRGERGDSDTRIVRPNDNAIRDDKDIFP